MRLELMKNLASPMPYTDRERWLVAGMVFVVALAHMLSFAYLSSLAAHNPEALPYPIVVGDSQQYAELADNLLINHTFSVPSDPGSPRHWPPGYPALLAGVKWITGSFTPVVVVQSLLSFLAVFLIYAIARRFVPPAFAACAALFYGLDPMIVFSDTAIISDGLFVTLLIIVVYSIFFQSHIRGVLRWSMVGVFLGCAVMTRAVGEFLIILLPAAFLFREWLRLPQEREEKYLIPALIAYALCVAIIVVPWVARNHAMFGVYEIAQGGADDLMYYDTRFFLEWKAMGGAATTVLYPAHHYDAPQSAEVYKEIHQALLDATPPGKDPENYTEKVALNFILQDPVRYAYFDIANTIPFFLSGSFSAYREIAHQERNNTEFAFSALNTAQTAFSDLRHSGFSASVLEILVPFALEVLYWLLVCLFVLCALIFEWRRFEVWLFAGLVAYFAAITSALSYARYRIPAEPFLLLLAIIGLYAIVVRVKRHLSEADFAKIPVIKHTAPQ